MFSNNYSKNREKKNEPNKKENLKNVLMHNCFPKPPGFETKKHRVSCSKKNREKNKEPNKKRKSEKCFE